MLRKTISPRIISTIAAIVLTMTMLPASPAQAFAGGSFFVRCNFVKFEQVDPIGQPRVSPSAHMHMFFGNKEVSKDSTQESLLRGTTNCTTPSDLSAYWAPVFIRNGQALTPYQISVYYLARGEDRKPFPDGFMAKTFDVRYSCGGNVTKMPADCGRNGETQFNVRFFNGEFPDVHVHYKFRERSLVGTTLSSGDLSTGHGDFFPAWDRARLRELVDTCLNTGRTCGKVR